jgi:hypothetical protein
MRSMADLEMFGLGEVARERRTSRVKAGVGRSQRCLAFRYVSFDVYVQSSGCLCWSSSCSLVVKGSTSVKRTVSWIA